MRVFGILLFLLIFSEINPIYAQNYRVRVATSMGNMTFLLYDDTPLHRDGFIELVNNGHFNGTLFYRVIEGFMILGGSKDSRNAPPGKFIGYGDPTKTVNDEILRHYCCKKGALCAPRQPDEINIFKQSDISQFFVVHGRMYTHGQLDTLELSVNRPIRNEIVQRVYPEEKRKQFRKLKEDGLLDEAKRMAEEIKDEIETRYALADGKLTFSKIQREAYTSIGGAPELDQEYTVFGELIDGMDILDQIASLKTDKNDRPLQDVVMTLEILAP